MMTHNICNLQESQMFMMMMKRRMTHNIYNLLESESEGEVDRLAVVEHRSLQARRQKTVTFCSFLLNYKNINNVEHGSKAPGCHRQKVTFYSVYYYSG